jgi:hypothetical protein
MTIWGVLSLYAAPTFFVFGVVLGVWLEYRGHRASHVCWSKAHLRRAVAHEAARIMAVWN